MALMHDIPRPGDTADVKQLWQYVTQLEDMVRYALSHIGSENITPGSITGESVAKNTLTISNMSGDVSTVVSTGGGRFLARVETLERDMRSAKAELELLPGQISAKASQTEVNGLSTRMNTAELVIDAMNTDIALKASQSDMTALETRVSTAEVDISGAKADILLKASQSDVTDLTTRVTTAEADIDGAEAAIALKASQSDVTALTTRVSAAEVDIDGAEAAIALKASITSVNNVINGTTPVQALETANSEVVIDPYGITMTGGSISINSGSMFEVTSGGKVEMFATDENSFIKFGGTSAAPNFSIGEGGNIKCNRITAQSIDLSGMQLVTTTPESLASRIVVSDTQPSGHGILWVKPSAVNMISYTASPNNYIDMSGSTPTNQTALTFVKDQQGTSLGGTYVNYGIKCRIYNYDGACRWTHVKVKLYYGNYESQAFTILDEDRNQYIRVGDYFEIDTLQTPVQSTNITFLDSPDHLKVKVTLTKDQSTYATFESGVQFILQASNNSSATAQTCTLKFIP